MNGAFAETAAAPAIDVGAEGATGGLEWLIVGAIVAVALVVLSRQFLVRRRGCLAAKSCESCAAGCVARGTPAWEALRGRPEDAVPPGDGKDPSSGTAS